VKDAVFQTTGQALSVSYLVMSLPARQKNAFRQALLQIIEGVEFPSARLKAWYQQLMGDRSDSTVNFDGLDPDEIRVQCAMVTQVVKDHLPEPEMHAVHARFIPTMTTDIKDETGKPVRDAAGNIKKRPYFSEERGAAIQYLAKREKGPHKDNYPSIRIEAMEYIIAKIFVNHSLTEISFRRLAADYGGDHLVYYRAFHKIRGQLKGLEDMAMRRLTNHFQTTGLVESSVEVA
jgi:hypothetical protein